MMDNWGGYPMTYGSPWGNVFSLIFMCDIPGVGGRRRGLYLAPYDPLIRAFGVRQDERSRAR